MNLLTERQTLEDGDHMHKAAQQARAASLIELPAATSSSQGTYDTEVRLSNFKLRKLHNFTVWLSVVRLSVSSAYMLISSFVWLYWINRTLVS